MNSLIRLTVALLAFLVGVFSSQLWSLRPRRVVQTKPIVKAEVVQQPTVASPFETWRKITIKGRFSFYIPPYLRDDGQWVSGGMAVGAFRRENYDVSGLYHLYYYSHNDTLDDLNARPTRYRFTTRANVMLGGKQARIVTEIPAADEIWCIHDVPEVQVYFPDIGRGKKLYLRLASRDAEGIVVARRIVDSIEFH